MGGLIKVTIKDKDVFATAENHTSELLSKYASMENLLDKITINELFNDSYEEEPCNLSRFLQAIKT